MAWTATVSTEGTGTVAGVMAVWTDVAGWPSWDARETGSRLDGPFAVGTTGSSAQDGRTNAFTITAVGPASWSDATPLPGGELAMVHTVTDLGDGRVRVTKTYRATGPLQVLFTLFFGRSIRRQTPAVLTALLTETGRRQGAVGG